MNNWEENVRRVVPYVPGEQPKEQNIIKLNTNENPYPPAPGVKEALLSLNTDLLRKYPDPAADALVSALAEHYHLRKEQVFVGVGSDDVLAMIFLTFFNGGKRILFPDITYSFYDVWADMLRIPYQRLPLNEKFEIVKEDYVRENGGVIFPNPNAPTGALLPLADVEEIVKKNQDVVVVADEAYIDFGGVSALPLTEKYHNLLVVQTFSKSRSMAGMRIGYAMGKFIYCFPWMNSILITQLENCLKKCLPNLLEIGAIIIIPTTRHEVVENITEKYEIIKLH